MASRVALDLPYWYWVMRLAPYRLIRMAIKMACEAAARFSVVDFLCCITVDKYQNLTARYTIVRYYVFSNIVYDGGPLTAMYAIVATVVDGERAIVVIYREAAEIN